MATMTEVQPLARGSSVFYGACEGIWVMCVFATPIKVDMLLARSALEAMVKLRPAGFPTLTWVMPEAGFRMDHDARTAASEVTKAFDRSILAQATLIDGSGFQAATVRAIIAGLEVVSRSTGVTKVFADLPTTVAWCAARRGEPVSSAPVSELVRAIAATRTTIFG